MTPQRCTVEMPDRPPQPGWFYGLIMETDKRDGESYPLAVVRLDGKIFLESVLPSLVTLTPKEWPC